MKNKREKRKVFWTRVVCIVLAALMISSIMYYTIAFLLGM